MATVTKENVNPSLIENTTMQKVLIGGVHRSYYITPNEGYVLRDNRRDWVDINPDTGDETPMEGYMRGTISVAATYDFTANPYDIRAVLESSVPADQIFGGSGNNNQEVM